MKDFRQKVKDLVAYMVDTDDNDVIENYTDSVMVACEEYGKKQKTILPRKAILKSLEDWHKSTYKRQTASRRKFLCGAQMALDVVADNNIEMNGRF